MMHLEEPIAKALKRASNGSLAILILAGMSLTITTQFFLHSGVVAREILVVTVAISLVPLLAGLALQMIKGNFSVDVLAAVSTVSAIVMGQYWVAAIVLLMLSGGKALEDYATRRASSVLGALAKRMPNIAHRLDPDGSIVDVATDAVAVGDRLSLHPHELCPVDGVVVEGNGTMDESYLTGEPFFLGKAPGAIVLSGAINGDAALTIQATRLVGDSRYARIIAILKDSEKNRSHMRRIADRLGAWYTPIAIAIAAASWIASGDPERFLAVVVIATPCPLLLAIPVAIIGAISVAARCGIVIKDPSILEKIDSCDTLIVDKTGTLTYGRPTLEEIVRVGSWPADLILQLAASIEQYSKHPLAAPVLAYARNQQLELHVPKDVFEIPGNGLTAHVDGYLVTLTGRSKLPERLARKLPDSGGGLEGIVVIDGEPAGILRFRDEPRAESKPFLGHLRSRHGIQNIVLLSGDRKSEVAEFARRMEITQTHGGQSPEEKVAIVRDLTRTHRTLYVGDGINDAPAMMNATAGIALGVNSDITSAAAGAVILQASLASIDDLIHIGSRMRRIALISAIGGMTLSGVGMVASAMGFLKPIEGALLQELIDLLAILHSLRVLLPSGLVGDFESPAPASPVLGSESHPQLHTSVRT